MEKRVRWGVISTANIGRAAVIPAIQASKNGELAAVASRDEAAAVAFAGRAGIARAYGSYAALLEDETIDAVYIPLPNSLHKEWTLRAARAGKHILCEKPLALDAAECLDMQAAADECGVKLMEAFMYRFHPRTERVISLVRGGALGELTSIQAAFTFRLQDLSNIRYNRELGGGALMDVGCYCVNIIRTLAGARPLEVCAFANWAETGVDRQMSAILRFANGLQAHFDCGLGAERRETCTVAGVDGHLDVPAAFLPGREDAQIFETHGRRGYSVHTLRGVDEYQAMVEHFAGCVLEDTPPRYSALEAADNMRVIAALYRSARRGGAPEPVEISL